MKTLIIAEKSSAGKDIARVLGLKESDLKKGYMENDKYVVGWARGHLVGIKEAKELYQNVWSGDNLPYNVNIDKDLKILVENGSKNIFYTLKELISRKDIEYIVNAGDSGREGELIQQWIYKMAGNTKPIKRLWMSSLTDESIKKAFNNLRENEEYKNLYEEGKTLKIIDWLFGMNYTVLLTKCYGGNELISYGRCQTPLLNLIVEREKEIQEFKKEKYYILKANYKNFSGILIKDVNGKYEIEKLKFDNTDKKIEYINKFNNYKTAKIYDYKEEKKEKDAPRVFSLSSLQQVLGKKYNYTPDYTLKLAQSLYEKKYTTYPRTNSEYLTEDIWAEKDKHIDACYDFIKVIVNKDIKINKNKGIDKKYVDNSKVEDHHGIIPTEVKPNVETLTEEEKNAYIEICKRFLSIFMETYQYNSVEIIAELDNKSKFLTRGKNVINSGYKILYEEEKKSVNIENEEEKEYENLPHFNKGDVLNINAYELKEQETKPKSRYTPATIIKLMEQYGIGTPATQSEIIKKLINIKAIEIKNIGKRKEYIPTAKGIFIISKVPEKLKSANLTKSIEEEIGQVGKGKKQLSEVHKEVFKNMENTINEIKEEAKNNTETCKTEQEIIGKCPFCGGEFIETEKAYGHKNWKDTECQFTIWKNTCFTRVSKQMAKELLENGKTIGTFTSKAGHDYKKELIIDKENKKVITGDYVNDKKEK